MSEGVSAWFDTDEYWAWARRPRPTFRDEDTAAYMRSDTSDPGEDPTGRGEITPEEWDRLERQQRGETGCLAGARHPPSGIPPGGFSMSGEGQDSRVARR